MKFLPKSKFFKAIWAVLLVLFAWAIFIELYWIPFKRSAASPGVQSVPSNREGELPESLSAQEVRVNEVVSTRADVTGDGVMDEISLKLAGAGWNQPFKWTLSIISGGKLVYEQSADDAWLDRFFKDKGYVNDKCPDYLACKKQYYLEDFFKYLFHRVDSGKEQFNEAYLSEIRRVTKESLGEKYGLAPEEAEKTTDWVIDHMKSGRAVILTVPKSPVQSECSQMYVPRVGGFVTTYCE
ncbi:MAG: hypothetical protein PHV33_12785 [Elusimicrobiales bacterium]|nr:hypothetical protein [Elusimicrobiales bacterium]